jgi:RNA recognition motif-containing protein
MEEEKGEEAKRELFVGNLSFNTTEDSVRERFSQYGKITNFKMPSF